MLSQAYIGLQSGASTSLLLMQTTTINCLTGVIPASGGDALVYGEALSSTRGMDCIRSMMGVCPQFDVLWNELTGLEHLTIYGNIKVALPLLKLHTVHTFLQVGLNIRRVIAVNVRLIARSLVWTYSFLTNVW